MKTFRFSYKWSNGVIEFQVNSYAFWMALNRANQYINFTGRNPETADLTYWEVK